MVNCSIPANKLHLAHYSYNKKYKGSVDLLGVTHCNINSNDKSATYHGKKYLADPNKAQCHTRCGPLVDDYVTSFISNPY